MSSLVARLVDQGLVHRGSDPQDARVVLLTLTPAGEDLVAQRRADRTSGSTRPRRPAADDVHRIADASPP